MCPFYTENCQACLLYTEDCHNSGVPTLQRQLPSIPALHIRLLSMPTLRGRLPQFKCARDKPWSLKSLPSLAFKTVSMLIWLMTTLSWQQDGKTKEANKQHQQKTHAWGGRRGGRKEDGKDPEGEWEGRSLCLFNAATYLSAVPGALLRCILLRWYVGMALWVPKARSWSRAKAFKPCWVRLL